MHPSEPFPRLLSAVTALHWSALFATVTVGALQWISLGQGAPASRLAGVLLPGPLARPDAAFVLGVASAVLALAFLWAAATAWLAGPNAAEEFRDVAQTASAAAIAAFSFTGLLSVFAGSTASLTLALAGIAALLGSVAAIGVAPVRAPSSALRSRAKAAAEQSRPVFDSTTPFSGKDR